MSKITAHCKALTKKGLYCPNKPSANGYCFTHDPTRGKERAQARRKGGSHSRVPHNGNADALPKQVRTLTDVLAILDYALAETLPMENSIQRGRLLVALSHAFIEAIKTGEFEARVEALESALKLRGEQ
ncbi:hypothetical protein FBQ82_04760 [Anaerolineae bacterium CFX7]|nr:hypothetical protein [Anaerolineae bacterium CFX7]